MSEQKTAAELRAESEALLASLSAYNAEIERLEVRLKELRDAAHYASNRAFSIERSAIPAAVLREQHEQLPPVRVAYKWPSDVHRVMRCISAGKRQLKLVEAGKKHCDLYDAETGKAVAMHGYVIHPDDLARIKREGR